MRASFIVDYTTLVLNLFFCKQCVKLLKASFQSKTMLSDVFLEKKMGESNASSSSGVNSIVIQDMLVDFQFARLFYESLNLRRDARSLVFLLTLAVLYENHLSLLCDNSVVLTSLNLFKYYNLLAPYRSLDNLYLKYKQFSCLLKYVCMHACSTYQV